MFRTVRYPLETMRIVHLTMSFAIALAIFLWSSMQDKWWLVVTVLMLLSAYHPGLLIRKSLQRMKGSINGVIVAWLLFILLQLNNNWAPLIFIIIIAITFTSPHYDVWVFYLTIYTLMVVALGQPSVSTSLDEAMALRLFFTGLGISICLIVDWILFPRLHYAQKHYALLQREICLKMHRLARSGFKTTNSVIHPLKTQQEQMTHHFNLINQTHLSIYHDLNLNKQVKYRAKRFSYYAKQMKKEIIAIYYCTQLARDLEQAQLHWQSFCYWHDKAKKSCIAFPSKHQ